MARILIVEDEDNIAVALEFLMTRDGHSHRRLASGRGAIEAIRAKREGREASGLGVEFPTVEDGARGVRFIERVIESGRRGGVWVEF